MFQSTVARIRFALSVLGFVVLGASLFNWAQALHTARHQFTWLGAEASNAPALDTAEIWQVSARCVRPYFIRAALRSKAKLKAYYELAPEAVRARLNRSAGIPRSSGPKSWYRLVKNQPDNRSADDNGADMEYAALLHVQYAEWYANVFKLEIEANRWQQRLIGVTDQRLMLSESARKSFDAYSGRDTTALGGANGFDGQVLATLGLGGFAREEEQALKSDCVKISLVNKVPASPSYLGELWRWPVEQTAAFALGLELILTGIFLVPITLWIGTGNPQCAAQHVRDEANRLVARVRNFDKVKFIADALERLHAIRTRSRVVLDGVQTQLGPVVNRQVQLGLRMAAISNIAIRSVLSKGLNAPGRQSVTSPPRPFPEYPPRS